MDGKIQVRDLLDMLKPHDPRAYVTFVESESETANTIVGHPGSLNLEIRTGISYTPTDKHERLI